MIALIIEAIVQVVAELHVLWRNERWWIGFAVGLGLALAMLLILSTR